MDQAERSKKREEFHAKLRKRELLEGFSYDDGQAFVTRPYWPLEPRNQIKPHLWKWDEVHPLVRECGEMIGLGHGSSKYDRRVLALSNPGSGGDFTTSGTLFADVQLIRAGEAAPCHRHTPCATRFILEGSGGWTTVAGERIHVKPGDIVYTGQFPWHDHGNSGQDDFVFLDVLDIPLLYFTGTSCWEFDYAPVTGSKEVVNQPVLAENFPHDQRSKANLRPAFRTEWSRNSSMLAHLSGADSRAMLRSLAEETGSRYDGIRLEMRNTAGGPVGNTVAVHTQWIRPGEKTLRHRHTGASIYVGVEGRGRVAVEEQLFDIGPKDVLVIPSWSWHGFESEDGCVLHSISDSPLIGKMGLYREQRLSADEQMIDSGWTAATEPFDL
jgi:gentisate 1,2-dioxygenase